MIKKIVGVIVVFVAVVFTINLILVPDNLKDCKHVDENTTNCKKADAIVAISGGDTNARVDEAVKLYNEDWADTLIFSGAAKDTQSPSNASVMKERAVSLGVESNNILIEEASVNTVENAKQTQNIFEKNNFKDVIVVTSSYHQRRAELVFSRYSGVDEVRSHPTWNDSEWTKTWYISWYGWYLSFSELVKILITYVEVN